MAAKSFDFLVVGAGLSGSVLAERLASQSGCSVLIVDRRQHIGGNVFDFYNDAGLLVHKYGPHIFHTNSDRIVHYLSQFTSWRPYVHKVLARIGGQLLPFPINLNTVNQLGNSNFTSQEMQRHFAQIAEARPEIRTSEDAVVSKIGRDLYNLFYKGYTTKQWGRSPSDLDPQITARIPVRFTEDDRYFVDTFQAVPTHGYTSMVANMLDHPRITLLLETDYDDIRRRASYKHLIYTGPIDEYFDHHLGRLPYRSLRFQLSTLSTQYYQPVATINYPNAQKFTRITEFKHITGQVHNRTAIAVEFPSDVGEPYYPVLCEASRSLYAAYRKATDQTTSVTFAGRLGTYRYYNMDQVVAQSLMLFRRLRPGR